MLCPAFSFCGVALSLVAPEIEVELFRDDGSPVDGVVEIALDPSDLVVQSSVAHPDVRAAAATKGLGRFEVDLPPPPPSQTVPEVVECPRSIRWRLTTRGALRGAGHPNVRAVWIGPDGAPGAARIGDERVGGIGVRIHVRRLARRTEHEDVWEGEIRLLLPLSALKKAGVLEGYLRVEVDSA